MISDSVIKEMYALRKTFKLFPGTGKELICKTIYVHKDIDDNTFVQFCRKAYVTDVSSSKDYEIVLMNENTICYRIDDLFYLVPGTVKGATTDIGGKSIHVVCDYGKNTDMKESDFIVFGEIVEEV